MGSLQQRSSAGRAYSAAMTPWLHLRGPTSKRRGGEEEGREKRRVEKEFAPTPNLHHRSTPLITGLLTQHTHLGDAFSGILKSNHVQTYLYNISPA